MRLGATIDVEHSHVRFLGNLVLNLWDCGGQEAFMENYFESQRDHIFRNVQVLIYVFDIESREVAKDMDYYASCLGAVKANSKNAKVFCTRPQDGPRARGAARAASCSASATSKLAQRSSCR